MHHLRIFGLLVLALAACAPSRTAAPPSTPAPARAEAAPAPRVALTSAPDNWWLLDEESEGVRGIGLERAYRELLADRRPERTVVVAILDSGVDIEHEDLRANAWQNPGERAGTGRDDDGNGYVDDLHGWNFIGGPDGQNVAQDTYEVARLYARLRDRFDGARPDTLGSAARAEFEQYRSIRREFEAERAKSIGQLRQMREIENAVTHLTGLLTSFLGTDSLTAESVGAIRSTRADIRQAQQVYAELVANDITLDLIREQRAYLERRVEYGLNPDFDPRHIVGDDYSNLAQRHYGNADVIGPDAEHGTHVAGIIAAVRDNDLGIRGIAPAVQIMVVRTVPDGDERDKDVANAIRYAVDNGAQIINMSFGKGHSPEKAAVDAAVRHADSLGVLLVHAAGNDGSDLGVKPSFPTRTYADGGTARHWIEVGASAWWAADSLAASFSNYGRGQVDVFAPGVDILSTVPGNEYKRNSGTSMAAPVVTGVAALLMAYFPELSAGDVKQIILDSARRYPGQRVLRPGGNGARAEFCDLAATCGVVNAYEAVRLAQERTARRAD